MLTIVLARSIDVNPLDRVGQVSGLAALGLRFLLLGLVILALATAATRGGTRVRRLGLRCAFAAVAGLSTGLVAGGIMLALQGTQWPLYANFGDSGVLIAWADDVMAGGSVPAHYPPAAVHVIAWLAEATGGSTPEALRTVQILGTAVFGPVVYLAWRLLLPPGWSLAVLLVAAFPLLEPYKPYTTLVLVVLLPVLVVFFSAVRHAAELSPRKIAVTGISTGIALGVLFIVYSGWFVWSAPGAVLALAVLFPWKTARRRGLALVALASLSMATIAYPHMVGLVRAAGEVKDNYFYFDTLVDPAYIAMWRNDLPGNVGPWPPPGELAGVGVFTLLLVLGLGTSIALAGRRTVVITVALVMVGAWVLRFYFASQMYETQSVQLYPRTTAEILFCLLTLLVLGTKQALARVKVPGGSHVLLGPLAAALLLALSMGSSVADRYLPRDDGSAGLLAYAAQYLRQPDGSCATYVKACVSTYEEILAVNDAPPQ